MLRRQTTARPMPTERSSKRRPRRLRVSHLRRALEVEIIVDDLLEVDLYTIGIYEDNG